MPIINSASLLIIRYAGVLGSFAFSMANFGVLFVLQREVVPVEFGLFALAQVFMQFGIGLSNAMLCSPIVVLISEAPDDRETIVGSFSRVSLIFSVLGAVVVGCMIYFLDGRILFASLFGALCLLSWTRWYFRSVELASGNYLAPVWADVLYSVFVLIGTGVAFSMDSISLETAAAIQLMGCLAAFMCLGALAVRAVSQTFSAKWAPFSASVRRHGKWALLGVATTEATANVHSYLVGFALGPAALAPIAAINLFYRPTTIIAQALTQFERPRMAGSIRTGNYRHLDREVGRFRLISLLVWFGNAALVMGLLFFFPQFISNQAYDLTDLKISAGILALIFLVRSLRSAESAALQAAGHFRPLAIVTVITAPITVLIVFMAVILFKADATISLVGIAIGEILMCALIVRLFAARISPATPIKME